MNCKALAVGLTQVCDAAAQLLGHQDVFALQVPVSDGRLPLGAEDLGVQVHQAAGDGGRHGQALGGLHGHPLQVVVQRAVLVVVGDEPQLGAGVTGRHVGRHEAWRETRDHRHHQVSTGAYLGWSGNSWSLIHVKIFSADDSKTQWR